MSDLTIKVVERLFKKMEKLGRTPVIHYTHYLSEGWKGPLVDEAMERSNPNFNKRLHEGYLVPIQWRRELEDLSDSKNESMEKGGNYESSS